MILSIFSFSNAQNNNSFEFNNLIDSLSIKSVEIYYYNSSDTSAPKLVYQCDIDSNGNYLKEYEFIYWEVVSYDFYTYYTYDEKGNLISENKVQHVLNQNKNDMAYIAILGDRPLNQLQEFEYNDNNEMIKQTIYTYEKEKVNKKKDLERTISYKYDLGKIIKTTSKTNSSLGELYTFYKYDKEGNTIRKVLYSEQKDSIIYKYDYKDKLVIEEERIDERYENNNYHKKFYYDDKSNLTKVSYYNYSNNTWRDFEEVAIEETEEQVKKQYYDNGLLKSSISDQDGASITLEMKYTFYK